MTQARRVPNQSESSRLEGLREHAAIDRIVERLALMDLPAKEHFERYMRHKWRLNHKPKTMFSSFTSVMLFLQFYGTSGKAAIEEVQRYDLEAFIEHEQDRGMYISTVKVRMLPSSPSSTFSWSRTSSPHRF